MKSITELTLGEQFSFAPHQIVSTLKSVGTKQYYSKIICGGGDKGIVTRVNKKSISVIITFRDQDRPSATVSIRFSSNKDVMVNG